MTWTRTGERVKRGNGTTFERCVCSCGTDRYVVLHRGAPKSSECFKCASARGKNVKHGHASGGKITPTWQAWSSMRERCDQPNHPAFKNYGGRGIKVCERWATSFENFLADMGERPPNLELDRIDNEEGYEPGNCRWTTRLVQARNRRSNVLLTHDGVTLTISAWAQRTGIKSSTIVERIRRGWSHTKAVTRAPSFARSDP